MTTPRDRCAHCGLDHHGEQRYAAIPGWHDWKADRTETARPVRVQVHMPPDVGAAPESLIASAYRRLWPPMHERWIRA